ncbi:MAG TPA: hypothetical protein VK669_11695 [Candidatus Limnocylindrales bacterium]|nr:hypothetical protein [Candidatus Limnocylindrales bacterium]
MPHHALSELELKTLYAAISLGDGAGLAAIHEKIVATGRPLARTNFYDVVNALERKGHVRTTMDRARTRGRTHNVRILTVTDGGIAAAAAEHRAYASLANGIEEQLRR